MRALPNEHEFVDFLRKLGNGDIPYYPQLGEDIIEFPVNLIRNPSSIIEDIYGNVQETLQTSVILGSAPKNDDCDFFNTEIMNRMPGEEIKSFRMIFENKITFRLRF